MTVSQKDFDKSIKKYGTPVSILLGSIIIAISIYLSFGTPNQRLAGQPNSPINSGELSVNIFADDDAFLGKENAEVVMIEFGDFQCPFCRSFWRESLPLIKENYIDTGKLKLVYRDFPLFFHPAAQISAEASECAREQGKFWEMHDKIFGEQDREGRGTIDFNLEDIKTWASEIGLDTQNFKSCLDSRTYQAEVKKDLADGETAGVSGTPTFFINGRKIVGALPYQTFQNLIEEELNRP